MSTLAAEFSLDALLRDRSKFEDGYLEFLRVPSLNSGIYILAAGANDPQTPHDEDEIYYVLSGSGKLRVDEPTGPRDFDARVGNILFVKSRLTHRFHSIAEELRLLVFFSHAKS